MLKRLWIVVVGLVCCCQPSTAQTLTAADFQCFMDKFAAGAAYANCDGVGGLTSNDFLCFVNAYAAGQSYANCDGSQPPSTGWTDLSPPAGALVFYVAANGSDSNPGTLVFPFRSLARGLGALRDGQADQLRLRAGDTWTGPIQVTKGCSIAGKYMVIGSYGTGPRPIIDCPTGNGVSGEDLGKRGIAIFGLDIRGHNVVDTCGVRMLSWDDVLIEGCILSSFRDNVVVQDAASNGAHRVKGFKMRRCSSVDAKFNNAPATGRSQGIYIGGCDGWLIEECLFDQNGIIGSIFSHNVYIHETCGPGDFLNNITARSASEGIQQRPGGRMIGNLGLRNSYDFYFGGPGEVRDNVALDAADIGPTPDFGRGRGFLIDGNTNVVHNFAGYNEHGTGWGNCKAFGFRSHSGTVSLNFVWDWRDNGGHNQGVAYSWDSATGAVTCTGNRGFQPFGNFICENNPGGSGNTWAGAAPAPGAGWLQVALPPNPACRIEDYMASLSLPGGLPEFIAECRLQTPQNWRTQFTAGEVTEWVFKRAGM